MITNERYRSALKRNANEAGRALLYLKVLVSLEDAGTSHSLDFIRLAYDAIFNDYIAHAINVFEDSEASSFWYLKRCQPQKLNEFCKQENIDISYFDKVKVSLKTIRNKTHFHIDRKYVKDSNRAWSDANLVGNELSQALKDVFSIICHLYHQEFGHHFELPEYNGKDAIAAAKFIEEFNHVL